MKENDIKGEHIFVTHEEWKHLATKFQIAAIPFATAVDKDGKLTLVKPDFFSAAFFVTFD